MRALRALCLVVPWAWICACGGGGARSPTPPPPAPARFPAPPDVGALVVGGAAFAPFARQLRPLLEAAPADPRRQFVIAMLDALDGRWAVAAAALDRLRAADPDPRARLMLGLTIRIWADAIAHEGDTPAAFGAALAALPLATVSADLAQLRAMGQAFTPEVCRALVTAAVKPAAGTIDLDGAHAIVFQRYAVVRLVPIGALLDRALAARGVALPE